MAKKATKKPATKPAAKKSATKEVTKKAADSKVKKNVEKVELKKPVEKKVKESVVEKDVKAEKIEKVKIVKEVNKEVSTAVDSETLKKWQDLKKKYGTVKALNYKMTEVFESNQAIQHKALGWGFILSSLNDRLEVIFESGVRQLISNYKAR